MQLDIFIILKVNVKNGPFRELNPGPPAPEAGIIPLDQMAKVTGRPYNPPYQFALY